MPLSPMPCFEKGTAYIKIHNADTMPEDRKYGSFYELHTSLRLPQNRETVFEDMSEFMRIIRDGVDLVDVGLASCLRSISTVHTIYGGDIHRFSDRDKSLLTFVIDNNTKRFSAYTLSDVLNSFSTLDICAPNKSFVTTALSVLYRDQHRSHDGLPEFVYANYFQYLAQNDIKIPDLLLEKAMEDDYDPSCHVYPSAKAVNHVARSRVKSPVQREFVQSVTSSFLDLESSGELDRDVTVRGRTYFADNGDDMGRW